MLDLACNYRKPNKRATAMRGCAEPYLSRAGLVRPIVPDPAGQAFLADFAGREGEDDGCRLRFRHNEIDAVHTEEGVQCEQRGTLVAIDKRMISRNAEGISRRQFGKIGLLVRPPVFWPIERGFEHAVIAQAARAAVDRELLVVNRNNHLAGEPKRLAHLASSAKALW